MHPVDALRRTAFLLEREQAATARVRAFRTAAAAIGALDEDELAERLDQGTLTALRGVGPRTAEVATQAAAGAVPDYLAAAQARAGDLVDAGELGDAGRALLGALRGDLHAHTDWSDGGSSVEEMALTAVELGHEHLAITDHSPHLAVARGLSRQRREAQLALLARLRPALAPFRLLAGIEVDVLDDGSLDAEDDLLDRLDVVVASAHSGLGGRTSSEAMTARLLAAVEHPRVRVLGHCTGRLVAGGSGPRPARRAEAPFDVEAVLAACARNGVAVEVNCRPERLDPPRRILRRAVELGCLLAVDTDAHAPGQLDWRALGAARAAACGADAEQVVTAWELPRLEAWLSGGRP